MLSRLGATLSSDQLNAFARIALLHPEAPLPHYTAWLSDLLGADVVMIGELSGTENELISVVAQHVILPSYRISEPLPLSGSPGEVVTRGNSLQIEENPGAQYPSDGYLNQHNFGTYLGVPLHNSSGTSVGLIAAYYATPTHRNTAAMDILEVTAPHIAANLSARISRLQLQRLYAIDHISAHDRFNVIAREAALVARSRAALICEWDGAQAEHGNIVSLVEHGRVLAEAENTPLLLAEMPCGELTYSGQILVLDNPGTRYPRLEEMLGWAPATYIGICLGADDTQAVGHIALVSDEPLAEEFLEESFWAILTGRLSLELLRRKSDAERTTLQQISVMRQKDDSLTSIAGHIAHDFNNLLMGVLGNTDLALITDNAEKLNKYLHGIRTSSLKAADLVSQLLNYAGKSSSKYQAVDLSQMLEQCEGLLRMSLPEHIEMSLSVSPSDIAAPVVNIDASQLEHVILNLVLNAVEACREDTAGHIMVSCDVRAIEQQPYPPLIGHLKLPAKYAVITVSDSGAGMDANTLSRIFDPFYSTRTEGRGLGLSTVRGFILSHNAGLDVETRRGFGTAMHLYFPITDDQPDLEPPVAAEAHGQVHLDEPILVVDDDPLVRQVISGYLSKSAIPVLESSNGSEALQQLAQHSVSAIISDVVMPEMDGWTLLRHVREQQPQLPFILMSGYTDNRNQAQTMDPCTIFLRKPFVEGTLFRTLAQLLQTHPSAADV